MSIADDYAEIAKRMRPTQEACIVIKDAAGNIIMTGKAIDQNSAGLWASADKITAGSISAKEHNIQSGVIKDAFIVDIKAG